MSDKSEIYAHISELGPGDHACFYYDDAVEQLAALVPFIRLGLERGERCVYLADADAADRTKAALARIGVDVEREVKRGALVISGRRDHLVNGQFDQDRMMAFVDLALTDALSAGFSGLRGTGDLLWEVGTVSELCKLRQYEARLDAFFKGKKLTGLCQYNRKNIPEEYLTLSLHTHPTAVFNKRVCRKNPFYRPAMEWANSYTESSEPQSFERMCQKIEE